MTAPENGSDLRLGFLTAIELSDKGFVAGLLVTNRFSRPLEFQCTTPVKPNRTQELLYGPTLRPFLLGELLSRPLIEKVSVKPDLIVTDRPEMLGLREHVRVPVVQVENAQRESQTPETASDGRRQLDSRPSDPATQEQVLVPETAAQSARSGGNVQRRPSQDEPPSPGLSSPLQLGRFRLRVDPAHPQDQQVLQRYQSELPPGLDLLEPIERVQDALREASSAMGGTGR